MAKREIGKIITMSTAHITAEDSRKLDNGDHFHIGNSFVLDEGGYLIHVEQDAMNLDEAETAESIRMGWSEAVYDIQSYANLHGCEYIRLDPDALVAPNLKTYEW